VENSNPAGRAGEHDEVANLCAYIVSDQAAYINVAYFTIDGGRWLQGAGMFSSLSRLSEAERRETRTRRSKKQVPQNHVTPRQRFHTASPYAPARPCAGLSHSHINTSLALRSGGNTG
jgi:hypothetical protein